MKQFWAKFLDVQMGFVQGLLYVAVICICAQVFWIKTNQGRCAVFSICNCSPNLPLFPLLSVVLYEPGKLYSFGNNDVVRQTAVCMCLWGRGGGVAELQWWKSHITTTNCSLPMPCQLFYVGPGTLGGSFSRTRLEGKLMENVQLLKTFAERSLDPI